jgi:hypothetical protein
MQKFFQFIDHLRKRIKNIFLRANRPTADFLEWCRKEYPSNITTRHSLSEYYPDKNKDGAGQDIFLKQITEIGDGDTAVVTIDQELEKDLNVAWPKTRIRYNRSIYILSISAPQTKKITLKEVSIKRLFIEPRSNVEIEIINCAIASLQIQGDSEEPNKLSLTVKDTYIGEFNINGYVKILDFCDGCLLKISCAVPRGNNPFRGSVWFKNVFFPTNTREYLRQDDKSYDQSYRNMSYHLRELENTQMAHLFHRLQLRTERERDSFVNKAISVLYGWFSDFGASALRPAVWLIIFVVISCVLIITDIGAVLAYPGIDSAHYTGWKEALTQQNECGLFWRSLYLSTQPIVNPLGIFTYQPVVIAKSPLIASMLLIQGFFSAVFIALIIFAIRRRFKLQ